MNNKILIFVSLIIALGFTSCKDQDEIYKEWVIPGGIVYPEKTNGLTGYAGYNRVMLKWVAPKDPSVQKAIISWNSGDQSMEINYADYAGQDTIKVYIPELEERSYTFSIKNYDDKGNISMTSEVSKAPYAANWLASCSERSIESAEVLNGIGYVQTGFATDNMVYTEYRYVTSDGETVILDEKQINDRTVQLPDAKPGTRLEYRSYYVPTEGLDTICNDWRKYNKPFAGLLDHSGFLATATESRWPEGPRLIFDGKLTSAGLWQGSSGTYPKFVFVDLQKDSYLLNRIYVICQEYAVNNRGFGYNQLTEVFYGTEPFEATAGDTNFASAPAFANAKAAGRYLRWDPPYWGTARSMNLTFAYTNVRYICVAFSSCKRPAGVNINEMQVFGYDTAAEE